MNYTFHEALKYVFDLFGKTILQQGRLTNYLADCYMFEPFDEKKMLCSIMDHYYGKRIYQCLTHSPYKKSFDTIITEIHQSHPEISTEVLRYVSHSLLYAWGKRKTIKMPTPTILLPTAPRKKKKKTILTQKKNLKQSSSKTIRTKPKQQKCRTPITPITQSKPISIVWMLSALIGMFILLFLLS